MAKRAWKQTPISRVNWSLTKSEDNTMDYLQQMTLEQLDTHIQQNESQASLKLTQTEP